MADSEQPLDTAGFAAINIGNLSVKCGRCSSYQTLMGYVRRGDWNVYTYECENSSCDPGETRTLIEVPEALDEFSRRDPTWHGGEKHAGSDH